MQSVSFGGFVCLQFYLFCFSKTRRPKVQTKFILHSIIMTKLTYSHTQDEYMKYQHLGRTVKWSLHVQMSNTEDQ